MATASPVKSDRLTVRAHFDQHGFLSHVTLPKGPGSRRPFGKVLHYIETPRETPSGGKYISRQFTLAAPGGRKWYGTMKKDSDVVTLRPASE